MKLDRAIDLFISDWRSYGRINSAHTESAFGDFVAKYAGLRVAQALLGHASVETTAGTYVDRVSLDEMTVAMAGFTIWPGVSVDNQPNELGAGKNDR